MSCGKLSSLEDIHTGWPRFGLHVLLSSLILKIESRLNGESFREFYGYHHGKVRFEVTFFVFEIIEENKNCAFSTIPCISFVGSLTTF
jgi:hypothetical protein